MVKAVRGFTLVEVCVAVAVLATGLAALGCFVAGFGQLRSIERDRIESVSRAVSRMEALIESPAPCDVPLPCDVSPSCDVPPPPCDDPPACDVPAPPLRQALAGANLYYAVAGDSLVRFRRIVRCK